MLRRAITGTIAVGMGVSGLVGSVSAGPATPAEPNPAPSQFLVTREDPGASGCLRSHRLGALYVRFNRALNAADAVRLRRFWREEREGLRNDRGPRARGTFKWFSLTNSPSPGHRHHFAAFEPRDAVRYVRQRRGFRLRLTEVQRGAYQGQWILDDGRVFQVVGKADFVCGEDPPLIDVWSMAVRDQGDEVSMDLCPDPPGGPAPGTLLVCGP